MTRQSLRWWIRIDGRQTFPTDDDSESSHRRAWIARRKTRSGHRCRSGRSYAWNVPACTDRSACPLFVRSVGMDSWNAFQFKILQLGGNAKVNQFLGKHGVPKEAPIHLKYNSAAAEAFREKIRVEAEGGKYVEPANIQKGLKQNTGETPAHQRTGFENGQTLGSSKGTTGMGSRSSQNDLQRGGSGGGGGGGGGNNSRNNNNTYSVLLYVIIIQSINYLFINASPLLMLFCCAFIYLNFRFLINSNSMLFVVINMLFLLSLNSDIILNHKSLHFIDFINPLLLTFTFCFIFISKSNLLKGKLLNYGVDSLLYIGILIQPLFVIYFSNVNGECPEIAEIIMILYSNKNEMYEYLELNTDIIFFFFLLVIIISILIIFTKNNLKVKSSLFFFKFFASIAYYFNKKF